MTEFKNSAVEPPGRNLPAAYRYLSTVDVIKMTLVLVILLQKIAIPGTASAFSFSFLVIIVTIAQLMSRGMLVDIRSLMCLGGFLSVGVLSYAVVATDKFSFTSFALAAVIQSFLIFRIRLSRDDYDELLHFFVKIMIILAFVGIIQYFSQFIVGNLAFALDVYLPDMLLLKGFNLMNPLYYGSPTIKSNGFFFLEPSFFNQFLAVAFVAEFIRKARVAVLALFIVASVLTYSGTGLTMLALIVPYHAWRQRKFGLVALGVVGVMIAIPLGGMLELNALTDRVSEFSEKQSSGYSRFVGVIPLLEYALHVRDGSLFFGRGPGSVQEYFLKVSFGTFDPTWGKVIYEYGLVGSLFYASLLYFAVGKGQPGLRFPLAYTYLVLGGYLLNPFITGVMALLVVWPGTSEEAAARAPYPSPDQFEEDGRVQFRVLKARP